MSDQIKDNRGKVVLWYIKKPFRCSALRSVDTGGGFLYFRPRHERSLVFGGLVCLVSMCRGEKGLFTWSLMCLSARVFLFMIEDPVSPNHKGEIEIPIVEDWSILM